MQGYDTTSLAAGISGGINAFADAFEKRQEEQKQRARLFKSLQEVADITGVATKDESAPQSLEWLVGRIQGTAMKRQQQMQALQMKANEYAESQRQLAPAAYADLAQYAQPSEVPYDQPWDARIHGLAPGQGQPGLREFAAVTGRTGYGFPVTELNTAMRNTTLEDRANLTDQRYRDLAATHNATAIELAKIRAESAMYAADAATDRVLNSTRTSDVTKRDLFHQKAMTVREQAKSGVYNSIQAQAEIQRIANDVFGNDIRGGTKEPETDVPDVTGLAEGTTLTHKRTKKKFIVKGGKAVPL